MFYTYYFLLFLLILESDLFSCGNIWMVDFSFLFLLVFSISSSLYRSNEGLMIWIITGFRLIIIKIHDLLPPLKSSLIKTIDSQKHGGNFRAGHVARSGFLGERDRKLNQYSSLGGFFFLKKKKLLKGINLLYKLRSDSITRLIRKLDISPNQNCIPFFIAIKFFYFGPTYIIVYCF
jgi:hypothetical protein